MTKIRESEERTVKDYLEFLWKNAELYGKGTLLDDKPEEFITQALHAIADVLADEQMIAEVVKQFGISFYVEGESIEGLAKSVADMIRKELGV